MKIPTDSHADALASLATTVSSSHPCVLMWGSARELPHPSVSPSCIPASLVRRKSYS